MGAVTGQQINRTETENGGQNGGVTKTIEI